MAECSGEEQRSTAQNRARKQIRGQGRLLKLHIGLVCYLYQTLFLFFFPSVVRFLMDESYREEYLNVYASVSLCLSLLLCHCVFGNKGTISFWRRWILRHDGVSLHLCPLQAIWLRAQLQQVGLMSAVGTRTDLHCRILTYTLRSKGLVWLVSGTGLSS